MSGFLKCVKSLGVLVIAFIVVGASETTTSDYINDYKANYSRPVKIPFPQDNLYTYEKAKLGKNLFYDVRLSADDSISCASCHKPEYSWEDGLITPTGIGNAKVARHSPTILNMAWGELYFWDGRAESLEKQALMPIQDPNEMGQDIDSLILKLSDIPDYVEQFDSVFPDSGITPENIGKAIATYERTIVSSSSSFDYWIMGNENAISEQAKRGFVLFNEKAKCSLCHEGWNFTDLGFHDIGLDTNDIGRYDILDIKVLKNSFKTPSLRNITERAPYMHNGSIQTLEEVIHHYNDGFVVRESLSPEIVPLNLTQDEIADLLVFLETLSSKDLIVMKADQ